MLTVGSSPNAGRLKAQEEPRFRCESRGRPQGQSGRNSSLLLCLFVLLRPSADWMRPTHAGEGNLLYSICQCKH